MTWADADWFAGTIKIRLIKTDEPRHAPMNIVVQRELLALKKNTEPSPSDPVFAFYPRYFSRPFNAPLSRQSLRRSDSMT